MTIWLNTPIQMQFRVIDGLSIRYAESEDQRSDHALLLSPWPESLLAFEPTWTRLAEHTHLVAIDLPGFGHSQRRDALLSPRAMGEFLISRRRRVRARAPARRRPRRRHRRPRCSPRPCIRAGCAAWSSAVARTAVPLQLGWLLKDWVQAPDLERYRSADPRQIVAGALTAIERYTLPDAVREDYLSSYEGDRFVESMRYVRAYPAELPVLRELLAELQTPVQIIAGAHDPVVPPANAEFLHERLPHSKLDILDAGHFTWEDAADEYAALVTSWWGGGYATTEAAAAR